MKLPMFIESLIYPPLLGGPGKDLHKKSFCSPQEVPVCGKDTQAQEGQRTNRDGSEKAHKEASESTQAHIQELDEEEWETLINNEQ